MRPNETAERAFDRWMAEADFMVMHRRMVAEYLGWRRSVIEFHCRWIERAINAQVGIPPDVRFTLGREP